VYVEYMHASTLIVYGIVRQTEDGVSVGQAAARKNWAAAMRAGKARKHAEQLASAERIRELEAQLAALKGTP
jgi:hypothetical protein